MRRSPTGGDAAGARFFERALDRRVAGALDDAEFDRLGLPKTQAPARMVVPSTDIISTLAARYLRHDLGREDVLGVVSFADFAPKGRLTRKLTHSVNRAAPMQAFVGAVPIVQQGLRTPTGLCAEPFFIGFIPGSGATFLFTARPRGTMASSVARWTARI